jgi:hypothetical protein
LTPREGNPHDFLTETTKGGKNETYNSVIDGARVVGGKPIEGAGWTVDEVGKAIDTLGKEIERPGMKIEPAKKK